MTYRVIVQPQAERDLELVFHWISDYSHSVADRWLDGIQTAIHGLEHYPQRCPLIPENDAFDVEVRQLLFGKRRSVYRIIFVIRDETVHVITVRHGARDLLSPGDIEELP